MAGTDSEKWLEFDPPFDKGNVKVLEANVTGTFGQEDADYGKALVLKSNCLGQIGDAQFNELLAKVQSPMGPTHYSWRIIVIALAVAPLFGLWFLGRLAMDPVWQAFPLCCGLIPLAVFCVLPAVALGRKIMMVKSGQICFAQLAEDGTTMLLQPGMHLLPCLGAARQSFSVTDDVMRFGTMILVRVRPGFIGLAADNGNPVLLLPGMHLFNSPNLEFIGCKSVNDDIIKNGPLHVVRVQPGLVGLASINGRPVILDSGVHFINEASFVMGVPGAPGAPGAPGSNALKKVDEQLIQIGQVKIIVVPRGRIAPVLVNGEGHFLMEGRHFISQARFSLLGVKSLSDEYVCAGTRHRILVPRGKIGLGLEAGEPLLMEPGTVHLKNSALFEYKDSVDITKQLITHSSLSIVTVRDGQHGISYKDGVIHLLEPGRHTLTSATHVPAGFISTGQQTLRISEVTGMSSDMVELRFDAAICMRVVDALKAVVMLTQGRMDLMQELQMNVQERAKLALSIIIGNNSLNKKHGATVQNEPAGKAENGKEPSTEDEDFVQVEAGEDPKGGDSFRQFVHDSFMRSFSASMLSECGILVMDMSIEDVTIVNQELAAAMASAAVANSSLGRSNIEAEIVQVKATAEAKVALIEARGKAAALEVSARAEADRISAISASLDKACAQAQQLELIRASGSAVSKGSTIMLAQDTMGLATLLSGAQGAALVPKKREM